MEFPQGPPLLLLPSVRGNVPDTVSLSDDGRLRSILKLKRLAMERIQSPQQIPSSVLRNERAHRRGGGRKCRGRSGRGTAVAEVHLGQEAISPRLQDEGAEVDENCNPLVLENVATRELQRSKLGDVRGARRRLPFAKLHPNSTAEDPPMQSEHEHGRCNQRSNESGRGRGTRCGTRRLATETLDSSEENSENIELCMHTSPGWKRPTILPSQRSPPVLRRRLWEEGYEANASRIAENSEVGRGNPLTPQPQRLVYMLEVHNREDHWRTTAVDHVHVQRVFKRVQRLLRICI